MKAFFSKNNLRLNFLLMMAILLSFNSFAWFVYSSRVANSITTRVRGWKVNFESGDNQVAEFINFNVDALYPGMAEYNNAINIINYSEVPVNLTYEIVSIKIMDEIYNGEDYQLVDLLDMLSDDFPFSINFELTESILPPNQGESDFLINIIWPFESGDDEADTYWGNLAYDYAQENPASPGIVISVRLFATQGTP